MLKAMIASCRKPSMTRPEFFHYMSTVHAPMAVKLPAIRDNNLFAVQNRTHLPEEGVQIATLYRQPLERDSLIELAFENLAALMRVMDDPDYLARIRPDEANFNDLSRGLLVFADEQELFSTPGSEASYKLFDYVRRRPGTSAEQFHRDWRAYGASLTANPAYRQLARKRIHNVSVEGHPTAIMPVSDYDGVACTFFDSFEDADRLVRSGLANGEKELVDIEHCITIVASGRKIIPQAM